MKSFRAEFEGVFGGVATRFGFSIVELSETEMGLLKGSFALVVYRDRDGVGVNYIRRNDTSGEVIQYPLGHFLATQRGWVASAKEERIASELEAYALTLERSASDILSGDDSWITQVKTNPFPVSPPTRDAIGL